MTNYQVAQDHLKQVHRTWRMTGVAGFIGSNHLETLLKLININCDDETSLHDISA